MKILFIIGSRREQSFNRQLALAANQLLADQAEITWLDYKDVPFFNQDIEDPVPESVARVRQACLDTDAFWIFTPEYNYQIPGGLKNLLDWLSRPVAPGETITNTAVYGKLVTLSGVGGKNKTQSVRKALDSLLAFMGMHVMKDGQTGIALTPEEWGTSVLTLNPDEEKDLKSQGESFLKFVNENPLVEMQTKF